MEKIYITGHRNPDMDSICSAISYAALKNLIDPKNEYIPIRCSHIGEGMAELLKSLEIEPPMYKRDMFPKVQDVMISSCKKVDMSMPLTEYAKLFKGENPSAVPVFDGDEFCGLLSIDNIANWAINKLNEDDKILDIPKIGDIMATQGEPLNATDIFEDAKSIVLGSNKRGLAVMDGGKYVGYVTRRCFLNTPKYNLILVDHNEPDQSIKGIECANVVEIIDHHRLNAIKTDLPLFIDAEPLGSTCTIVYQLFLRNGIKPAPKIARTMLSGLLSDTLILKSPTTTKIDVETAYMLATICGEDVEEFGKVMFSNVKGLNSRNPDEAIVSDFKVYTQNSVRIGIGQCEVTTLHDAEEYIDKYLDALENIRQRGALNWTLLMVTDVLKERSILLSSNFHSEKSLPYSKLREHVYDMPGVMSRKKQLLPEILHASATK